MIAAWLFGTVIIMLVFLAAWPGYMDNAWGIWLLNDLPLYGFGLPAFLLVARTLPAGAVPPRPRPRLRLWQLGLLLALCFGVMYLLNYATLLLTTLLDTLLGREGESPLDALVGNSSLLPNLLFGAVVPAVGEEFVFRGVLVKKLQGAGAGDGTIILFTALCFGVFHGNLAQLFYAFGLGLIFAWLRLQTGSLVPTMLLHFSVNAVGLALVPALGDNDDVYALLLVFILCCMVTALLLTVRYAGAVRSTLAPPRALGWPGAGPLPAAIYRPPWQAPPAAQPYAPQVPPYQQQVPPQQPYAQAYPPQAQYQQPQAQPYPAQPPQGPGAAPPHTHPYAPPYAPPAAAYAPPYAPQPYAPPPQPMPSFRRVCLSGAGVITLLAISGVMMLVTLLV